MRRARTKSGRGPRLGELLQLATDLGFEGGFGREMGFVAVGEYFFLLLVAKGVFHGGVVFVGAEDEPERGVVARSAFLAVEIIHVELQLAEVGVGELADLEVQQIVRF